MNSVKYMFFLLLLTILVLPLCAMWIVSIILESCAKVLDNVVGTVNDWVDKQLGGGIDIYE